MADVSAVTILHNKIEVAGIQIWGVKDNGDGTFTVDFKPESTAQQITDGLAIVAAFDPVAELAAFEAATATERVDLAGLSANITAELTWITTAIADIDIGLAIVDAATLAQLRAIVKGLMQNQRRILLEQRAELKGWRYVVRRLL